MPPSSSLTKSASYATESDSVYDGRSNPHAKRRKKKSAEDLKTIKNPMKQSSGYETGAVGNAKLPTAAYDVQATSLPDPIPAENVPGLHRTTLVLPPTFTVANPAASMWIYASETGTSHSALPSASDSVHSSSTHTIGHLPIFITVLVAVGATSLALAAILVLRCFLRRHNHTGPPTPSAPILQDSPLFGGKERLSRGLWTDPSFGNLLYSKNGKADGWRPLSGGTYSGKVNGKGLSVLATFPFSSNKALPPLSPASVYTTAAPSTMIGVATDSAPIATQPLKIKDKGGEKKTVRRRSVSASMYGGAENISPTFTDTETTIAYQAPRPAPSPGMPKPALKNDWCLALSRSEKESEEPFMYALPTVKSQERRDRDTKALTSALGLASPPPPSSCFSPVSIYPDDSLSVAHGRARPVSVAPPSEMPSPSGTHAALGSLMLQEFPSTATFASLCAGDPFAGEPTPKKKGGARSAGDRPPRVPSPPPLPSLAQMAMSHAEPDYHSPTYSIYGLYEAQRKSKQSFSGN
ncbi:hypothetical protein DFH11DRAFT_1840032 [Phellopilus nigrolimitatus]|nr:hypothetical protein DFH11DRAFT_1840032 [Phellopilus nigrolimitatus]